MVTDEDLPAFWREFLESLGERPGGRCVAEIYRRHRGGSAELTPAEDRSGGRGGGWPTWRSLCSGSASADRPLGQTTGSHPKALATRADGSDARLHARAGGSIGEVYGAMRDVFGEYCGGAFF